MAGSGQINWVPSGETAPKLGAAIKLLSDNLTALGVTKTSDTGQIDVSSGSITPPATASTNTFTPVGYEIRKLESAGKPTIFLRIEYGVVARTANSALTYVVTWRIDVGHATNGAGVLSRSASLAASAYPLGYSSTTGPGPANTNYQSQRSFWMASDGQNYLTFTNDPAQLSASDTSSSMSYMNFALERYIDRSTGAYTGEGFVTFAPYSSSSTQFGHVTYPMDGRSARSDTKIPFQFPGIMFDNIGSNDGANYAAFETTIMSPKIYAPATVLKGVYLVDLPDAAEVQINGITYKQAGKTSSDMQSAISQRWLLRIS